MNLEIYLGMVEVEPGEDVDDEELVKRKYSLSDRLVEESELDREKIVDLMTRRMARNVLAEIEEIED